MTTRLRSISKSKSKKRSPQRNPSTWLWLDIAAVLTWGVLLLKYWLTGKVNVLLHPDYVWLAASAGFFLVGLGTIKGWQTFRRKSERYDPSNAQHQPLVPTRWSSGLLLAVALFGLQFTPRPFASDVALERGVTDTLTMTRSQPQAFRSTTRPEDRSIIDWVRTLNVYPEPDAYTGQKVNVEGFVIYPPDLSEDYLLISRFVITCCAADVYPVGLPVKLPAGRSAYPPDQWFRVEGTMATETLNDQRQLVIHATNLTSISEPENPYDY
jgi:uncharacterized repeat protein (TIGR03943 family)